MKVLRTYARRYRFAHPTTEDFLATVDEVTGGGWRWYFNETFFWSDLCDYAVEVKSEPVRKPAGYFPDPSGALVLAARPEGPEAGQARSGRTRPVASSRSSARARCGCRSSCRVEFADGRVAKETVERRRHRRYRLSYEGAKVVRAVVDPARKIAIDVDPANNEWLDDERPAHRAAAKWAARYLFWLQNLLELHMVVG